MHLQGLWFFGVRGAALILLVGIFFGGEASADTCSQPQVNCGEAASEDCSTDCPVSACWSLDGSATPTAIVSNCRAGFPVTANGRGQRRGLGQRRNGAGAWEVDETVVAVVAES